MRCHEMGRRSIQVVIDPGFVEALKQQGCISLLKAATASTADYYIILEEKDIRVEI